jgi:hypothetical protein
MCCRLDRQNQAFYDACGTIVDVQAQLLRADVRGAMQYPNSFGRQRKRDCFPVGLPR